MAGDPKDPAAINTGGGAYVGSGVSTQGGDFVGRDKLITAGERSVVIGGNVADSSIVTGDHNVVSHRQGVTLEAFQSLLGEIRGLIHYAGLEERKARTLEADVQVVEEEVQQPKPDKSILVSKLEGITKVLKAAGNLTDVGQKLLPLAEKALEWGTGLLS